MERFCCLRQHWSLSFVQSILGTNQKKNRLSVLCDSVALW
jgi:hypothetical protein